MVKNNGHAGREKAMLFGKFGKFWASGRIVLSGNVITDFEAIEQAEIKHGESKNMQVITRDGEKYKVCNKCKCELIVKGKCEGCD